MYERILVPLDGSKIGEAALPYVEQLVAKLSPEVKAEVTLLHIISSTTYYVAAGDVSAPIPYTEREMEQVKNKAAEYLNKAAEGLRSKGTNVKITIETGNAAEEIIKAADKMSADLIAMSTHGRSGISRWAFGSVTDRVLRSGNKPVLIVRAAKDKES